MARVDVSFYELSYQRFAVVLVLVIIYHKLRFTHYKHHSKTFMGDAAHLTPFLGDLSQCWWPYEIKSFTIFLTFRQLLKNIFVAVMRPPSFILPNVRFSS